MTFNLQKWSVGCYENYSLWIFFFMYPVTDEIIVWLNAVVGDLALMYRGTMLQAWWVYQAVKDKK
jgi:hypothetical protein